MVDSARYAVAVRVNFSLTGAGKSAQAIVRFCVSVVSVIDDVLQSVKMQDGRFLFPGVSCAIRLQH